MAIVSRNGVEYSIQERVKRQLDKRVTIAINSKDRDFVALIDGPEGSGKTTFGMQLACYVDEDFDLSRVCFTPEEFRDAILKAEKGQCVIFDEAFTGFSSRSVLSGINKMLVSLMQQMRQKNLFVIVILPSFFLLDWYVAEHRSKILFHVYEKKDRRGFYLVFNKKQKKKLWLKGRKFHTYNVKTHFRGRFFGKFPLGPEKEKEYREKKLKALSEADRGIRDEKKETLAGKLLWVIHKEMKLSAPKMEKLFEPYQVPLKHAAIGNYLKEFKGDVVKK